LVGFVSTVAFGWIGASSSTAQIQVTSVEELRRELAAGDVIAVVPADGPPVVGRLMRLGDVDLDLRLGARPPHGFGPRDVSIALAAIRSLERPRDSARNGVVIGAGIGAGIGGAMFAHALVVDRNEIEEWAAFYIGAAAVATAVGALLGWAVDAANSKPHLRFDAGSGPRPRVSVHPVYAHGSGIAVVATFSP
jgi:hypothetical protein